MRQELDFVKSCASMESEFFSAPLIEISSHLAATVAAAAKNQWTQHRRCGNFYPRCHEIFQLAVARDHVEAVMAKILLMEDDADQAGLIAEGLLGVRHEVIVRHEAHSALQALTESRFDLLISDMLVPHTEPRIPNGGVLLIGRVRNSRHSFGDWSLSDIPILAISGGFVATTGVSMERIAKSVGASAYRQKPLSLTELRSAVDMLLSGSFDPEPTLVPPARAGSPRSFGA